ncbi:MAG: deoxyguanosinetriphosphate triphosphohydrolase [Oscillospiraceae bacterium]|nr:deoxyguanosinetriphosphate triphosphohydrolase [Oscillospiraceae bacterium]
MADILPAANARERWEQTEYKILAPYAAKAGASQGRRVFEEESGTRTAYQRDVDRITHSKAYRRLIHKTQVFLSPKSEHYRTRLTHTLEVSRIARTIARALALNEDLTEAIAAGHDLGHAPFGHAGERALDAMLKQYDPELSFRHSENSLRVVTSIEKNGEGLNLTLETEDGILNHTHSGSPATLEGKVVRLSDRVAYLNHDCDDAIRAGILAPSDLPELVRKTLGERVSDRINALVTDAIAQSRPQDGVIALSDKFSEAYQLFFQFMTDSVYKNPTAKKEEAKVQDLISALFKYYYGAAEKMPSEFIKIAERDGKLSAVCGYISCMTDNYAIDRFTDLFVPKIWAKGG